MYTFQRDVTTSDGRTIHVEIDSPIFESEGDFRCDVRIIGFDDDPHTSYSVGIDDFQAFTLAMHHASTLLGYLAKEDGVTVHFMGMPPLPMLADMNYHSD